MAMTEQPPNRYVQETNLPDDYAPPEGIQIIRPFKELTQFYPCEHPEQHDWVGRFEVRYLRPLANNVARVFGVPLIDDAQYTEMPEEAKATYLSVVLTRADILQTIPGTFEWMPICVVARYSIVVGIQIRIDPANNKIQIPMMLLWNNLDQQYVPVGDSVKGHIENPAVILQVLSRYARMERLI